MAEARYHFGPLEQRGLVVGLRAGQLVSVAAGLFMAVGALRAAPGVAGAAGALASAGLGLAVAFVHVGGATVEQWLPDVWGWWRRRLRGQHRFVSPLPLLGTPGGGWDRAQPVALAGLSLLAASVGDSGTRLGVIADRRAQTYAAVLEVRGQSFALLEATEKQRRLAGWAAALSGLARPGCAVSRVQWVERSRPNAGDALGRFVRETLDLSGWEPAARSYRELVAEAGPLTQSHDVYLVLAISSRRSARAIAAAGGGRRGAVNVLWREIRAFEAQLRQADVVVDGPLGPSVLAWVLRSGFEPDCGRRFRWGGDEDGDVAPGAPPVEVAAGATGPLATEASWSSFRSDGCHHVTYWVREWPRIDVGPDFLTPLLLGPQGARTVALTMEPLDSLRAARATEAARVADVADEELRRRAGFLTTARRRREAEAVLRREVELADGHAECRFSAYVTVSAANLEALDAACSEVEQAAGQSHLELRRLYGRQDAAFTYTLPLARGLT